LTFALLAARSSRGTVVDRDLKEQLDLIKSNQKAIHEQLVAAHRDLAQTLESVVAILRGIEDELRRQRK
jgi:hypothetical protein